MTSQLSDVVDIDYSTYHVRANRWISLYVFAGGRPFREPPAPFSNWSRHACYRNKPPCDRRFLRFLPPPLPATAASSNPSSRYTSCRWKNVGGALASHSSLGSQPPLSLGAGTPCATPTHRRRRRFLLLQQLQETQLLLEAIDSASSVAYAKVVVTISLDKCG